MKKLTLIYALIMAFCFANAQDDYSNSEIQTIFSGSKNNGGYGAFSLGYSEIDGSHAFVSGMRGGFIFDHKLAIGLGGYAFANNLDNNSYDNTLKDDLYMAGGYGGIFIEPIAGGKSPVHVSFPILFGIGGVALNDEEWYWAWEEEEGHNNNNNTYDSDLFLVVEPGVELEFNMARFFRLAVTASYRLTSDIELYATDEDALRGLHFGMVFKFGKF